LDINYPPTFKTEHPAFVHASQIFVDDFFLVINGLTNSWWCVHELVKKGYHDFGKDFLEYNKSGEGLLNDNGLFF